MAQIAAENIECYRFLMRTTMNLSLPEELKRWVDEQVESGGYGTASEYVRDLLRRARERQLRHGIDAMLVDAVESGAKTPMNDGDWKSIRSAARARAAKRKKR